MCHHGVGMDPCGLGPTFELSVPSDRGDLFPPANLEEIGSGTALRFTGGTNSSNPVSSSSESANFQYLSVGVISQRGRHDGSRRRSSRPSRTSPRTFREGPSNSIGSDWVEDEVNTRVRNCLEETAGFARRSARCLSRPLRCHWPCCSLSALPIEPAAKLARTAPGRKQPACG